MTQNIKQAVLDEIAVRLKAKTDFATFAEYIHRHDLQPFRHSEVQKFVCGKLQEVVDGKIKNIIINLPPNSGKSVLSSVLLPAYFLGHNHTLKIYCTSHTTSFSIKSSQQIKFVMNSPLYKNIFPDTKIGREGTNFKISDSSDFWQVYNVNDKTNTMGSVTAKGILSGSQGERVDVLIVDDLYANRADANSTSNREKIWSEFQTGLMSRLNPNAVVIILNTRFHVDDLSGMVIKNQKARREDNWEIISLPAIALDDDILGRTPGEALWPERFPIKKLLAIKNGDMPEQDWEALYQQSPVIRGGAILKRKDWQIWSEPDFPHFEYSIMSIDCALKANQYKDNDYHACTIGILFRPQEEKLDWAQVVAMIRRYALSDEQILSDLKSYYEGIDAQRQDPKQFNSNIHVDIDSRYYNYRPMEPIIAKITLDDIRSIRLGIMPDNPIDDRTLKLIRADDLDLSTKFGRPLPVSLIRKLLDNPLTRNTNDSFSTHDVESKYYANNDFRTYEGEYYSWKEDRPYNLLIIKAWQERCGYVELKQRVISEYDKWKSHYKKPFDKVLIEDTAAGPSLIADLYAAGIQTQPWNPGREDKETRAFMASPMFNQGRVWGLGQKYEHENPRTGEKLVTRSDEKFSIETGIETLIHECEIFPNGSHDDLVDTVTMMVNYVRTMLPIRLTEDIEPLDEDDGYQVNGMKVSVDTGRPRR